MAKVSSTSGSTAGSGSKAFDAGYQHLEKLVGEAIGKNKEMLFTTDVSPEALISAYIDSIPVKYRSHYKCNCCFAFIRKYGGLVSINKDGETKPLLWGEFYVNGAVQWTAAMVEMANLVRNAKVTGRFLWEKNELCWGKPITGNWTHLAGVIGCFSHDSLLYTASQLMAEKKHEFVLLSKALSDYSEPVASEAQRILKSGLLNQSDVAIGQIDMFVDLHERLKGIKGRQRENVIWHTVSTIPKGFAHLGASNILATLMDQITANEPFETIKRAWNGKVAPLNYQRPKADPTDGNVDRAEAIFEKLNLTSALRRRFATLEDVQKFEWKPKPLQKTGDGVFDAVRPSGPKQNVNHIELPFIPVSAAKFRTEVLPHAVSIKVLVPHHGTFYGLATAVDPDATPIIQWDSAEKRNPVSWYFYANGSPAARWGLKGNDFVECTGIFLSPNAWQEGSTHQGLSLFFALKDCRDSRMSGLALFPVILRSELREVRSTIERFSNTQGTMEGAEAGNANGLALQMTSDAAGSTVQIGVRVTLKHGVEQNYRIVRWE